MKILVFSHEFPPRVGGAGVVAKDYASKLVEEGHEVDVLTSSTVNGNLNYDEGFHIKAVATKGKTWFLSYRNILNFESYDEIILNDQASIYTAGLFFSTSLLEKSTCFLHGSEPERIYLEPSVTKKVTLFRFFYRKALLGSKQIIAVSQFMQNKYLRVEDDGEIRRKLRVVVNRVDDKLFYPTDSFSLKNQLELSVGGKVMLSASRIVEGKGYLDMLNMFKYLVKSDSSWYWVIAGEGNYLSELQRLVREAHLTENVRFVGSIAREELKYYYSMADVFCLLSNMEESYGLVYREAQLCGCPVIARNNAGAVEAIIDGVTGKLVDNEAEFFSAIELLMAPEFDRQRMLSSVRTQELPIYQELFA